MSERIIENNRVSIIGEVVSGFTFSHEVLGEESCMVDMAVNRLSEQADTIPPMISERFVDVHKDYSGYTVESMSQFRPYDRHKGVKDRLMLSVFVGETHFIGELMDYTRTSQILLDGYICKPPTYGGTPLGWEITDTLLTVNRSCGRSDRMPCISQGRNVRSASDFKVDTRVRVRGRMQSREYTKKLSETECEKRIVYEVSINKLECDEA